MPRERFTWTCDGCGQRVANGQGYLVVDDGAALDIRRAWKQRRRELAPPAGVVLAPVALSAYADLPHSAPWHVWHRGCDPEPDRYDYWLAVENCRTLAQLLDWNAHLHEKSWLHYTDWDRFIQRRLAPNAIQRGSAHAT